MAGDYEILGVDFHHDMLYFSQLERVHDRLVWTNSACVELAPDANAGQIAEKLRQSLDENGFTARKAVFSLYPESGFLQFSRTPDYSPEPRNGGVIEDSWQTPGGKMIYGVVPHADVMRIAQIASHANLEIIAIEIRSIAAMHAMGVFKHKTREMPNMALLADRKVITLGLLRGGELQNIQTHIREQSSSLQDDVTAVVRMLRLMELSGFEAVKQNASLQVVCFDRNIIGLLKQELGVEIESCSLPECSGVEVSRDNPDSHEEYSVSLGLAIEGMRQVMKIEPQFGFNFLSACFSLKTRPKPSLRKIVAGAIVLLVILIIVLTSSVISKQLKRTRLAALYSELEPRRQAYLEALDFQRSLRNWLPADSGGQRTAYRPIFDAITEMFPSTDQAYVTSLEIRYDLDGKTVLIRMEGRSRSSEVLFEFISRLNNSMRFDKAALGKVTDLADATSPYIKKFSLTFAIRQKNDA